MISRSRIKWIKSLEMRKYRIQHGAFVAEGPKLVGELMTRFRPLYIAATGEWLNANHHLLSSSTEVDEVSHAELERVSMLRSPQSVLAVMPIPTEEPFAHFLETIEAEKEERLLLALDGVQDPGNLGTILRICDWFGIRNVLCSEGTTDAYGPKCVQSCMGALARVRVHYGHLPEMLRQTSLSIYGTFLDGTNIYNEKLSPGGIIVMGNEGNGISSEVAKLVTRRLRVPNYPEGTPTTESLNVAVCTGIVCAEFRRRTR